MKAAVCTAYGSPDVLQVRDVRAPRVGSRDLLVRIRASSVTVSDTYIRSGVPTAPLWFRVGLRVWAGFTRPRSILGAVIAGEIEQVGSRVTRFKVGQRVMAFTMMRMGAYAEYARVPEKSMVTLAPARLTNVEVAAIPYGGLLALYFLRRANIQPGERVLVYGASGANGSAGVQIARHFGADVTAVCGTANLELARSLGASSVVDYTQHDSIGAERYDVVFDAVGRRKTSALKQWCATALTPAGRYTSVDDKLPRMGLKDLELLASLAESGALKPVVDRQLPLEQIADAHRYVEEGHKRGNVIITMGSGGTHS